MWLTETAALFLPLLTAKRRYLALKYVCFVLEADQAAYVNVFLSHGFPGFTLPLLRLPALSLFPGLTPAQEER